MMSVFQDKQLIAFIALLGAIVALAIAAAAAAWRGQMSAAQALGGAITGLVGVMQFPRWPQGGSANG
jgi:membrane associated rhomboid family serine protease